jgi:hypothetical protein
MKITTSLEGQLWQLAVATLGAQGWSSWWLNY